MGRSGAVRSSCVPAGRGNVSTKMQDYMQGYQEQERIVWHVSSQMLGSRKLTQRDRKFQAQDARTVLRG